MSTTCAACGVAVIPGYVRCPRCGAQLAGAPQRRLVATPAGGTAIARRGVPVVPIVLGLAALAGVIAAVVLFGADEPAATAEPEPVAGEATPAPRTPAAADDEEPPGTASAPTGAPDPSVPAGHLRRALTRERLWGTVELSGTRVDVRSGACDDPAMGPVIDAAASPLREAGLTRLRCLEQSGRVVFERDL